MYRTKLVSHPHLARDKQRSEGYCAGSQNTIFKKINFKVAQDAILVRVNLRFLEITRIKAKKLYVEKEDDIFIFSYKHMP
jgi:hypothetical protein